MRVKTLLCEAAADHPDGTVSLHRAGINRINTPTVPVAYVGALLVRIEYDESEALTHRIEVRCDNEKGTPAIRPLQRDQSFKVGQEALNIIVRTTAEFAEFGNYSFTIAIDGEVKADWRFKVVRVGNEGNEDVGMVSVKQ